jgi:2,4-diaminopentanoate dehydrogenase
MTYRVIQWATGYTARLGVQALAERPDYALVGAFVYTPEKAGRDLGELCATRTLGVRTTADRAAILATRADCVLFMGGAENDVPRAIDDICALLASGKNVVTTSANFIYPRSLGAAVEKRFQDACSAGHATFHGLGVMPGFVPESVALTLTRLSRRIDRLVASEVMRYDTYPSRFQMFELMGFGYLPDDPRPAFSNPELVGETWRHSAMLIADTAGLRYERIECFRNVELATRDLQVAAGLIPKGTVGAMNFGVRVIAQGEPRIVMQHYTRMDADLAPHWPGGEGWQLLIEGAPSIAARIEIGIHGEVHTEQGCLATAMHAIHAVPYVIAAAPGILTLAEVPPVWGCEAFAYGGARATSTRASL